MSSAQQTRILTKKANRTKRNLRVWVAIAILASANLYIKQDEAWTVGVRKELRQRFLDENRARGGVNTSPSFFFLFLKPSSSSSSSSSLLCPLILIELSPMKAHTVDR